MKIQIFDFSINVMKALLWRHNEAVNLQALLQNKQDALNDLNQDFWESWVVDVFDLRTANEFGLLVWSIILNIPVIIDDDGPTNAFGFGPFRKNFDNGQFGAPAGLQSLTIEQARTVLKLRYYQLVTRATIPECNKIVNDVFDSVSVSVLDGLDMTMLYVFSDNIKPALKTTIEFYDLLPRPSGVKIDTLFRPNLSFGFGEFRKNFDNGSYIG